MGEEYNIEMAMRYQNPSIEKGMEKLLSQPLSSLTIFPLFPQYASATTGSVYEKCMEVMKSYPTLPALNFIPHFPDHPGIIDTWINQSNQYEPSDYDHLFFSYHGLPKRQIRKSDPHDYCYQSENCCQSLNDKNQFCYRAQCFRTTRALAETLNLPEGSYTTSFQSRLGSAEWLKPYTQVEVEERCKMGERKFLVFCPSFVADCLETTIEIGVELEEDLEQYEGIHVDYVKSLNAEDGWVEAAADIINQHQNKIAI